MATVLVGSQAITEVRTLTRSNDSSPEAEGGPVCNHMSPNFDSILWGTHRRLKKTWVDIPDEGQKAVIQDRVQDGRRTLMPNITPYGSVLA